MQIPFSYVHPSSIIDKNVSIGVGTEIWHFCHISSGANIGENCTIGDHVYIGENVSIGNGCKIQNNVFIPSGVVIEQDVFLGPNVVFTNIRNPRAFVSRKKEYKTTIVFCGASIGANCTIICGNFIGKYAMIGAGSVVTKDIGDYCVAFGNPAESKGHINILGDEIIYGDE